jgi:hypothetical protein
MKTFFDLPNDILSKIYDYDDTYRDIFKKQIAKDIWHQSWRVWSSNYVLLSMWENSRTELGIEKYEEEKSIYRFTMTHFMYRYLWASKKIYCDDVKISILSFCDEWNEYITAYYSIYVTIDGLTIFKGRVFTIEQFKNFQGNTDGYDEIFKGDEKLLLEKMY